MGAIMSLPLALEQRTGVITMCTPRTHNTSTHKYVDLQIVLFLVLTVEIWALCAYRTPSISTQLLELIGLTIL